MTSYLVNMTTYLFMTYYVPRNYVILSHMYYFLIILSCNYDILITVINICRLVLIFWDQDHIIMTSFFLIMTTYLTMTTYHYDLLSHHYDNLSHRYHNFINFSLSHNEISSHNYVICLIIRTSCLVVMQSCHTCLLDSTMTSYFIIMITSSLCHLVS